jgi:hypothetical protein
MGKVFCSIMLALLLLLVAALSAVAVATGRFQFWTFLSGNDVSPAYILRRVLPWLVRSPCYACSLWPATI